MQAVILAAGKGLRLRPFTENHPKPLILIADKALLHYTLEALPDAITEIIIVVGYLGDQIIETIGDSWNGLPIQYVNQPELSGTGNALLMAKDFLRGKFLAINGDDLYRKSDLTQLLGHDFGILAWQSTKPGEFGLLADDNNMLRGFSGESSLINCGAYVLTTDFFKEPLAEIIVHKKTEYSLPHTLVALSKKIPVGVVQATHWLPVGTPEQFQFANSYYIRRNNLN